MIGTDELTIADMLCSTGYLPPRNEQDLNRFDQIYKNEIFEIEAYSIDANAIFDSVIHSASFKQNSGKKLIKLNQTQLKAASSIKGKRK